MRLKEIKDECFQDYKKSSMLLSTITCDWKCCIEGNFSKSICQNNSLYKLPTKQYSEEEVYNRYISNPITEAVIIGGLEPFLQFEEIYKLIKYFRNNNCFDEFIIYTGCTEIEIEEEITILAKNLTNIIVKFGRYIPDKEPKYNEILGIFLSSNNQYAKRIS